MEPSNPLPASPRVPPGWYPDPDGYGNRWWDGSQWGPRMPLNPYPAGPPVYLPQTEKSSGLAVLFTILWPGAGHLYLGLSKKGTPHTVANAIGLLLAFTLILFPVACLIWLITLCMTVGSVSSDTLTVNQALREGRHVIG